MISSPMKFPANYFMNWFREKISANKITLNFHYEPKICYVDDFLLHEIDEWNSKVPIIISAQTGAGKNHFIQKTLLPKLIEENPNQDNLILILSNRIALNRQTKKKLATLLVEYTHNSKYITEIDKYYTPEGVDQLYLDFDVVTVCSYHQLYRRCFQKDEGNTSIDIKKFKYVICDECHFFTSDSIFNEQTNKILKEIIAQGQNAIRIYTSATPEVAFEVILMEEYYFKENEFSHKVNEIEKEIEQQERSISMYERIGFKKKQIKKEKKMIARLNEEKEYYEDTFNLSIHYYHMKRNYNYVKPHIYKTNEELVELIRNSSSKWMVFSDINGKKIYELLSAKENSSEILTALYLSRKNIEDNTELKRAYNYIIDEETIEQKVLITTSILDNGINITNSQFKNPTSKVLNIAIDTFDREQFIQMLGRIRVEEGVPVQLYIREYSLDYLKKFLKKDALLMIQTLHEQIKTNHRKEHSSSQDFNLCKIYKLINKMNTTLAIIRNEEPNFCIEFANYQEEAQKGLVYEFYKTGEGKTALWSRSIVDLLESFTERIKREKYIEDDINNGEQDVTRHESKFKDSFLYWLYSKKIPEFYMLMIKEKFLIYLEKLTENEHNKYKYFINKAKKEQGKLSIIEKLTLLQDNFDFDSKDTFINMELISEWNSNIDYYRNLASKICSGNITDEQLNWIGKNNDLITHTEEQIYDDTCEEYILAHFVNQSDIEAKLDNNGYIDIEFLQTIGILKNSDDEKNVSKRYFKGNPLTKMLNRTWNINGTTYILQSKRDNTRNHKTYYCFINQNE